MVKGLTGFPWLPKGTKGDDDKAAVSTSQEDEAKDVVPLLKMNLTEKSLDTMEQTYDWTLGRMLLPECSP